VKTELLDAFLNGELSAERAESFEAALRHDEAFRDAYLSQLEMDSAIGVLHSRDEGSNDFQSANEFTESVMARLRLEGAAVGDPGRGFTKSVLTEILKEREGQRALRWPDLVTAGFVAAAASVALMFALQGILYRNPGSGNGSFAGRQGRSQAKPGYIARVQNGKSAQWAKETAARMRQDGWLSNGMIKLESGTALVAFNSGATALIEGPAALSLETPNRAFLQYGLLTAEVPSPASGFAVNTPRMNVVDLGTRFGVAVDRNGDSDLHVMQGKVEASRSSGNSVTMLVREGLSLRADSRTRSELQPIPYDGDLFTLRLSSHPIRIPQPAIRYRLDESGGSALIDSGSSGFLEASLLPDPSGREPPKRAPGHTGGGLMIQPGQSLETVLTKKFRLETALTFQFWLKVSPSIGKSRSGAILSYGREGMGWKILCNQKRTEGSRNAVRVEFGNTGYLIGSTDLGDGQWHHVAVRFLGGNEADIATHLHLFVDGKLENISGWRSARIESGSAEVLVLGSRDESGFQGWIDDLEIFREAISTRAIQAIN